MTVEAQLCPQDRARVSIQGRHGVKGMQERSRERQAKEQARWKEKQGRREG